MSTSDVTKKKIVFFDGVCNLCNHWVDFLMRYDRSHQLHFAPLQGQTAKKILPEKMCQELKSIVYYNQGQIFTQSDAALRIISELGPLWKIFYLLLWIPRFIRNFIYDQVAKSRYNIFGKSSTCRVPTSEEKEFFLD